MAIKFSIRVKMIKAKEVKADLQKACNAYRASIHELLGEEFLAFNRYLNQALTECQRELGKKQILWNQNLKDFTPTQLKCVEHENEIFELKRIQQILQEWLEKGKNNPKELVKEWPHVTDEQMKNIKELHGHPAMGGWLYRLKCAGVILCVLDDLEETLQSQETEDKQIEFFKEKFNENREHLMKTVNSNSLYFVFSPNTVRFLEKCAHILASIVTGFTYTAVRAYLSYQATGSAAFWKTPVEKFESVVCDRIGSGISN